VSGVVSLPGLAAARDSRRWPVAVIVVCRLLMVLLLAAAVPVMIAGWDLACGWMQMGVFAAYIASGLAERRYEALCRAGTPRQSGGCVIPARPLGGGVRVARGDTDG
jgi:hypothetical protein